MAVDLQESRKKINAIDAQIARLFEERMQVSTDVARYKMETGKPIFDPDRERQVIERIKERFPYRDEEFRGALAVLFQTIMDLGKEHQKREMARISEPKVAYFGLPGAFTHEAMEQFFGAHADASHFLSTQEIFQAVEEGKVRYGVVPIENSTTGIIQDVYDGLSQYNLYIVREGVVPITQNLLGVPGATLEDVREVYSHAQGFAQSEQFFSKHPDWNLIPYFNTAKGAEHVSKTGDKAKACVASLKAAEIYHLEVLQKGIQDNDRNITRFIVLSKLMETSAEANKISLYLKVSHQPGTLYHALEAFSRHHLDLLKIESRPIPQQIWEYGFFIDLEGNVEEERVQEALREIRPLCLEWKLLGNYISQAGK